LQEFKVAANAEALRTGKNPLLLTAAVPAGKRNIDNGYEVQKISQYVIRYFGFAIFLTLNVATF
jgi:hypothetical protein